MPKYHVQVEADFEVDAKSSEDLRKHLVKVLKQEGFEEQNFEFLLEKVILGNSRKSGGKKERE